MWFNDVEIKCLCNEATDARPEVSDYYMDEGDFLHHNSMPELTLLKFLLTQQGLGEILLDSRQWFYDKKRNLWKHIKTLQTPIHNLTC